MKRPALHSVLVFAPDLGLAREFYSEILGFPYLAKQIHTLSSTAPISGSSCFSAKRRLLQRVTQHGQDRLSRSPYPTSMLKYDVCAITVCPSFTTNPPPVR